MKVKNLVSKHKTIIVFLITIAMVVASCFGFVNINIKQDYNGLFAASEPVTTINDPNFDGKTGSYPIAPSTSNYETSATLSNTNVTAGIINNENSKYSKYPDNTNSNDHYFLMISTDIENGNPSEYINFGYRTTDGQIKLEADSNYIISVDVLTDNTDGIGSLYLYDKQDGSYNYNNPLASIKHINTMFNPDAVTFRDKTKFITCYFFVSTNNITTYDLKLGMYLEGKGTVLFDNICINKVSVNQLNKEIAKGYDYYTTITATDNLVPNGSYTINNGNLDFNVESGTVVEDYPIDNELFTKAYYVKADNTTALIKMTNDITLKQNHLYKITAYAKVKDLAGTIKFKLKETTTLADGEEEHSSAYVAVANSSNLESATNGYQPYTFYLRTYTTHDANFNLQLDIGEEYAASAEIYISSVVVSYCNYSDFKTAADSCKVEMVTPDLDSAYWIANGNFDLMEIGDYTKPFPASATDWEFANTDNEGKASKDGTQYYGVVNNANFDEMRATLGDDSYIVDLLPLTSVYRVDDNYLMLCTNNQDTLSAKSKTKSLSANSYYKLSINAYSINAPVTISLVTTINSKEVTLVSKDVEGNVYWNYNSPINLYVYTGNQSLNVAVKVSIKAENNVAVACIDEVLFANQTSMTADDFALISNDIKADWSTIKADNIIKTSTSGANASNVNLKTIVSEDEVLKSLNMEVVGISSILDKVCASYSSNIGFSLETGDDKYYEISVKVYTKDIEYQASDEIKAENVGISIGLSGYEKFTAVQSNNSWTTYTFYIKPSSASTTYFEFDFGSNNIPISGYMYIGDFKFAKIDKETFEAKKASNITKVITTTPEESKDDETEEETEEGDSNNFSLERLPYYISSIIFALAIIAAVIGILSRKIKWKKPTKKTKIAYDRNKTVSKQYYSRRATALREEHIANLNKELDNLVAERTKYEEEYKHDLTKLRELKIKRAPASEISALEKQLKKNQKMSAALGGNLNRLEAELDYVKSEAYLASLIKKLEREQVEVVEEQETDSNKTDNK